MELAKVRKKKKERAVFSKCTEMSTMYLWWVGCATILLVRWMDCATNSLGLYDFFKDRGWTVMSAVSILQAYYYFRNIELQRVLENSFQIKISI